MLVRGLVVMEHERASSKSEHSVDDALYAVYAPPRTAPAPLPALPGEWSARAMFAAALRDQRRVPWRALLLLGLIPGVWDLPASVFLTGDPAGETEALFDWRLQGREAGRSLLYALWSAVLLGGQTLVSLDIAREGSPPLRRLLDGVRFTPALFVATATGLLSIQFLTLVAFGAGPDAQAPRVLAGLFMALLLLVPIVCLLFASAMVAFPLVERRRGLLDALARVWELLGPSLWRFFRLSLLTVLCWIPLFAIGWATSKYATNALMALFGPTFFLAWTHAYLRSCGALESPAALGSSAVTRGNP